MLYSKVGTTETAYVYVGSRLLLKKDGTGATPEARYYHQDVSPGSVRFVSGSRRVLVNGRPSRKSAYP